jgi:hypothetical protein
MLRCHWRLALLILSTSVLFLFSSAVQSGAQDAQSQSVAEAARRAKEATKKASAKSKVITDDDLAKNGDQGLATPAPPPDASAQPATGAASAETADASKAKQSADASAQKIDADKAEVARLKAELAQAERDLDLTKRESALGKDSYYSQTDYARDTAGKAKIDALQQAVTDKEKNVQDLKDRVAALEASLKSSTSAPASTQPAPPAPPQS